MNDITQKRFILHTVFYALIGGLVYFCSRFLVGYLTPLVFGVLFSVLIQRPLRFLCKKTRLSRGFWSVVLVVGAFAVLILLCVLLGFRLYGRLQSLITQLPRYMPGILQLFSRITERLSPIVQKLPPAMSDAVHAMPEALLAGLYERLTAGASALATKLLSAAPTVLFTFFVCVIACCYITRDFDALCAFVKRQIPCKHRSLCKSVKVLLCSNILKMLRGYAILLGITFAELSAGLLLLGVDWAIPIAALIAAVDILPVLGVGTVLLPWAALQMLSGNYFLSLGLLACYAIITVVRSVLEPKIIAGQVGLNPLVTLLAMYCGFKLFGLAGLVGLPILLIVLTALQKSGQLHIWQTRGRENQEKAVE